MVDIERESFRRSSSIREYSDERSERSLITRHPYNLLGSLSDPNVRMHLKWINVHYWITKGHFKKKVKKDILRGLSGEAKPGQVDIHTKPR